MRWWRRWSGMRRAAWVLVAIGLLALSVALPLRGLTANNDDFNRIVGWANILAYSVGAVGLLLMVVDRRRSSSTPSQTVIDDAADQLAGQVLTQEGQQRARLLGTGRVTTTAANLRYEADRLVRFRAAGSPHVGDLEGIARFYAEHTEGRLIILGAPGSGKTVLALELLIQLLEQRRTLVDPQVRAAQPVPVRFSLPAWNTDRPLPDWLTADVAARFGMSDGVARALVEQGRILPVLDGLDEMDPPTQTPSQAEEAVAKLNTYLTGRAGLPLVVTCRIEDYQRLSDAVRPAVEITIQPLTMTQIRGYLDREFQTSADAVYRQEWQQVLTSRETHRRPAGATLRPAAT